MEPIPYAGPPSLEPVVLKALSNVIDPEMVLNIVDLGLVYGVAIEDHRVEVRFTMTSAACPMGELMTGDVTRELQQALGGDFDVHVELCWDPPWTPERLSASARAELGY